MTECPICLEVLQESPTITTPCCHQQIHTKCLEEFIEYNRSRLQDSMCPLCRSVLAEYIAIDLPDDPPNEREPLDKRLLYLVGAMALHISFIFVYKFAIH